MKDRYALVAATEHIAQQLLDAFGLKGWEAYGYTAAVTGSRFERLVILRPHWNATGAEIAQFETEFVPHWHTRVPPGGTFKVI
ncbi:hypothetical protein [Bradyrhizobium elkanii]|uniref:Uncharacterized protein n=1 Tax=Bradyrhizobium elkanii TaxID=29448 RepID=A0ABV4F1E7_BRAEL|nr:hypothetical protein [Bradyrhizobium elkanii]MCP1757821.1 hypothetical protein [Bradyrhizobium elkanii]MCS3881882.1 hypothetical protein [Bradyrhizobium elkanii]MCS4218642.1 hypothetical protein [Bradyrhizobium elkanii]MCW2110059.1 hypothetical protein [Bradyrhizobium elkanii]MCW2201569.1 hypothetical protein [Bradyrhizobium elkanii]